MYFAPHIEVSTEGVISLISLRFTKGWTLDENLGLGGKVCENYEENGGEWGNAFERLCS